MLSCFRLKPSQFTNKRCSPTFLSCQPCNTLLSHPGLISPCPSLPVIVGPWAKPMRRDTCTSPVSPAAADAGFGKAVGNSDCWALPAQHPAPLDQHSAGSAKARRARAFVRRKEERKIGPEIDARSRPAEQDVTFFYSHFSDRRITMLLFSTFLEPKILTSVYKQLGYLVSDL